MKRLVSGPAAVGEASGGLGVSKPAVTKHLKVLEDAGFVTRAQAGRTHVLRLETRPLREASEWLELHRSLWEAKFGPSSAISRVNDEEQEVHMSQVCQKLHSN